MCGFESRSEHLQKKEIIMTKVQEIAKKIEETITRKKLENERIKKYENIVEEIYVKYYIEALHKFMIEEGIRYVNIPPFHEKRVLNLITRILTNQGFVVEECSPYEKFSGLKVSIDHNPNNEFRNYILFPHDKFPAKNITVEEICANSSSEEELITKATHYFEGLKNGKA